MFQVNLMGGTSSFPYESVRREVYRANGLDAAETAAALALENSLTTVDEQVRPDLKKFQKFGKMFRQFWYYFPGLAVTAEGSRSQGCGFEALYLMLEGYH